MSFEKMSILDIFQYNMLSVFGFTMIGVVVFMAGFAIRRSVDKTSGNLIMGLGVAIIIILNIIVVVSNQSKELMNGESTISVQSAYHINGNKIVKLNVDGHPIRLKDDNELRKGDRVHIKAKNVEVHNNNIIKYNDNDRQLFKYEKVN